MTNLNLKSKHKKELFSFPSMTLNFNLEKWQLSVSAAKKRFNKFKIKSSCGDALPYADISHFPFCCQVCLSIKHYRSFWSADDCTYEK